MALTPCTVRSNGLTSLKGTKSKESGVMLLLNGHGSKYGLGSQRKTDQGTDIRIEKMMKKKGAGLFGSRADGWTRAIGEKEDVGELALHSLEVHNAVRGWGEQAFFRAAM